MFFINFLQVSDLRSALSSPRQVSWTTLAPMPTERPGFSVEIIDESRIFLIGKDFCDVYDVRANSWTSVQVPFTDPAAGHQGQDRAASRPVTAALGSSIYVFGNRPVGGGVNSAWILDCHTLSCQPLVPSPETRFDPKGAFSHNGMIYLVGWQAATNNFVSCFDPRSKKWSLVVKGQSGHFSSNGILTRKSLFPSLQL